MCPAPSAPMLRFTSSKTSSPLLVTQAATVPGAFFFKYIICMAYLYTYKKTSSFHHVFFLSEEGKIPFCPESTKWSDRKILNSFFFKRSKRIEDECLSTYFNGWPLNNLRLYTDWPKTKARVCLESQIIERRRCIWIPTIYIYIHHFFVFPLVYLFYLYVVEWFLKEHVCPSLPTLYILRVAVADVWSLVNLPKITNRMKRHRLLT